MNSATMAVEIDDVVLAGMGVEIDLPLCRGCQQAFTPKVKTQLYCKQSCRSLLKPVGKRAAYPMVSCIFPGCTAPPFRMMRPDHRFCTPKHRAKYYAVQREEETQRELTELRSENERLRKEVDRYIKPIRKKAS